MKILLRAWQLLLVLTLIATLTAQAQEKLQKVKIASGGHVVHFLPLDLAVALGYFKDHGLEPEVVQLKGGTATAQALLTKQVDFSLNSIDHAFKAAAQGRDDLRMVTLLNQTPGMVLVVHSKHRNKVKTIADLKGMNLGVTARGSASHMVLAFLLAKNGVRLEDVSVINAGTSTFPPALKNGDIDGGIAIEPFASIMVKQGDAYVLQRLITSRDSLKAFGGPYSLTGVLTRQDVIQSNSNLVSKVVNAHVRALRWIQSHSEEEIADVLPVEVVGSDKAQYVATLKSHEDFFSRDGVISSEGAENVLMSMLASGVIEKATNLQASAFFTNGFLPPKPDIGDVGVASPKSAATASQSKQRTKWVYFLPLGILVLGAIAVIYSFRRAK
jgi:NitT/TauT family transport system substrate-binding protein